MHGLSNLPLNGTLAFPTFFLRADLRPFVAYEQRVLYQVARIGDRALYGRGHERGADPLGKG